MVWTTLCVKRRARARTSRHHLLKHPHTGGSCGTRRNPIPLPRGPLSAQLHVHRRPFPPPRRRRRGGAGSRRAARSRPGARRGRSARAGSRGSRRGRVGRAGARRHRLLAELRQRRDACRSSPTSPAQYDIIAVAFADATGTPGAVGFTVDPAARTATAPTSSRPTSRRSRPPGRTVIISVGGENGTSPVSDTASAAKFANSVYALMQTYGFDGVDIDLENGIDPTYMTQALRALHAARRGSWLIITMAPQTIDMQSTSSGYFATALNIKDILTVVNTQYYNSGSMNGCDGKVYSQGSVDFLTALACIQLEGGLDPSQVGLGTPASTSAAGSRLRRPGVVNNALDCLAKGTGCGSFKPATHLPRHPRRDDLVHQLGRGDRQRLVRRGRPARPRSAVTWPTRRYARGAPGRVRSGGAASARGAGGPSGAPRSGPAHGAAAPRCRTAPHRGAPGERVPRRAGIPRPPLVGRRPRGGLACTTAWAAAVRQERSTLLPAPTPWSGRTSPARTRCPRATRDVAVGVHLARVVEGALLAVLVTGVVDARDLAGGVVDDRRAEVPPLVGTRRCSGASPSSSSRPRAVRARSRRGQL